MPAADRVAALGGPGIAGALDQRGCATTTPLLTGAECAALIGGYDEADRFRSRIVMARHGYGRGEYQDYACPLPTLIGALHAALHPALAAVANHWGAAPGSRGPRRRCCATDPATATACIRTSKATCTSPCKPPSCATAPATTSPAASSP